MSYKDVIIWIGQSYPEILCKKVLPPDSTYDEYSDHCYPDKNRKKGCYVHEAELRGCCRKVATISDWMIPEKSRVFLVHRDGKGKTQGSLFGYFVLKRFEIITEPEVYEGIIKKDNLPWPKYLFNDILQTSLKRAEPFWEKILVGENVEKLTKKVNDVFYKFWPKKFLQNFSKGRSITFHPRNSPTQPRSEEHSDLSNPGSSRIHETETSNPGEFPDLSGLVENTVEELIADWVEKEAWFKRLQSQDKDREYALVPWTVTQFEPPRFCSKRLKLGADYLVDVLTAIITDRFIEKLKEKTPSSTFEGEEMFRKTVNEVKKEYEGRTLTEIPKPLRNYAETRGGLVLFREPYPTFEKRPQASFRGFLRVDGEKLIDEICRCYEDGKEVCIPRIPYYPGKR